MSAWPLAQDFCTVLQHPKVAFRNPELQGCRIRSDRHGLPIPRSGRFATVFEAVDPSTNRSLAVRVFTVESSDRDARFRAAAHHLSQRRVGSLVDFRYEERGIRTLTGDWHPLVVMDWVQGRTLFNWLAERCRLRQTQRIANLADAWVDALCDLAKHEVAHGDLHHDNVLVDSSDNLKFVDYDCLCVPELVGAGNPEVGMAPYQHPERCETTPLSLKMDAFSGLFILTAMRALAAQPDLWDRYVARTNYDRLLLRLADLESAGQTGLSRELLQSPDPVVRSLTRQLFDAYHAPMDQLESFPRLIASGRSSWKEIKRLVQNKDWDEVNERMTQSAPLGCPPDKLRPWLAIARRWVRWKTTLEAAVQSGEASLVEPLLKDVAPEEYPVARGLIERAQRLVAGDAPVDRSEETMPALEKLLRLLARDAPTRAVMQVWRRLQSEGGSSLLSEESRRRVRRAEQIVRTMDELRQIPTDLPLHEYDARILAAWRHTDDTSAQHPELSPWRWGYQKALDRQRLLRQMEDAVRRDDAALLELARHPLLSGYLLPPRLQAAVASVLAKSTSR